LAPDKNVTGRILEGQDEKFGRTAECISGNFAEAVLAERWVELHEPEERPMWLCKNLKK